MFTVAYHALEHLSDCGKVLFQAGSEELTAWQDEMKWELLWRGFEGIGPRLEKLLSGKLKECQRKKVEQTLGYFRTHEVRLCYAKRLSEGRSIGSGQVEGACKNMIGKRLKQTGARWRIRRLNGMASLCAVRYSGPWKLYWNDAQ